MESEVINSPKVENDSIALGNPEDHGDSDHIETVLKVSDENDQVEKNEDEDNTGRFLYFSVIQ